MVRLSIITARLLIAGFLACGQHRAVLAGDPVGESAENKQIPTFSLEPFDGAAIAPVNFSSEEGAACCAMPSAACDAGFFGGAEFLLVRPHFGEAVAFARGTQTVASFETTATELHFDYDASLRTFLGYRLGNGGGELRFTYWNLNGDVSVDGTVGGAGEFIVDPFGNLVGGVGIIDPGDLRFGNIVVGGDLIETRATVKTNIYDIEFAKPLMFQDPKWALKWSAGVRIADIDQYYESIVSLGGNVANRGDFHVDFIGAGPRLGLEGQRFFGNNRGFSLYASGHGSLLLGEYDVRSSNTPTAGFLASQAEGLTRTVPVFDTELGAKYKLGETLTISAGWMFQTWFDMGTSGGRFGGFFAGADDSNIMSFDGLVLRAELSF